MGGLITVSDLEVRSGEPRVEDLRLADALGFSDRHMIRTLIKRHIEALQQFGEVSVMQRKPGSKGGRPSQVFYLNEEQAIYITAKSDTPRAAEITVEMVRVFRAYLKGEVKPVKVRQHRRGLPGGQLALPAPEVLSEPFAAHLDLLQDLKAAVSSARVRVMLRETDDFGLALEEVLVDRIKVLNGKVASGKTLLDWNLRRTGGTHNSYRSLMEKVKA